MWPTQKKLRIFFQIKHKENRDENITPVAVTEDNYRIEHIFFKKEEKF